MKKLFVCMLICLMSSVSLAEVKYTSEDGTLVIPNVNVDGQSFWDSVTLKLDMAKGTFSITDAKQRADTTSDQPLQKVSSEGYDIGFLGCTRTGEIRNALESFLDDQKEVSCAIRVVNTQPDRSLTVHTGDYEFPGSNNVVDNRAKKYYFSEVQSGDKKTKLDLVISQPQNKPVKITYKFWVDIGAKSLFSFNSGLYDNNSGKVLLGVYFNDIKF